MDEEADDGPWLALIALAIVLLIGYGAVAVGLSATSDAAPADDAPDASWDLSRVNESHVRLTHAGGEPVPASQLSLSVNGTTRYPNWDFKVVTDSDSGTFQADSGSSIVLVWQRKATDQVILARWDDV
jgi:FlaG/FlaF family flagellin (archaellin)